MAAPVSSPCSSPPTKPSSSSSLGRGRGRARGRARGGCCFLLQTNRTTSSRPAAVPVNVRRGLPSPPCALPETAGASLLVALGLGAGVLLLRGSSKETNSDGDQEEQQQQQQVEEECCSACGGSGLCPRCKGEGFVFKEVAEETASRARKAAKNMATRYTAGLPTKWTYCNRCSSTRSCTKCQGTGTQVATPTS